MALQFSLPRVASPGHINWKLQLQAKNKFSRKPTVKLIRFDGVCEIELIWGIQNIDKQIQKDGFWSVGN
jgi:hypothetical protein